jgi:hypothetical protein
MSHTSAQIVIQVVFSTQDRRNALFLLKKHGMEFDPKFVFG